MAEKQRITTPQGELMYVNVRGEGKLNYDGDDYDYVASIKLPKKQGKKFYKTILAYFEDNKPAKFKRDKPVNTIYHETEDGDWVFTFKTQTSFENSKGDTQTSHIKIFNSKNVEKELPEDTMIGNGSIGFYIERLEKMFFILST